MVSLCREKKVPVLLYAVPMAAFTRAQLDGYIADSIRQSGEAMTYEPGKDMRVMREFFTANNLPWMDLEPQIAATPEPSSLFIPGDGHFNPKGCRLVADAIAARIAADGYLQPPAGSVH
jgi:glycine/D-amino acid oxidase-like deaminating enzyme